MAENISRPEAESRPRPADLPPVSVASDGRSATPARTPTPTVRPPASPTGVGRPGQLSTHPSRASLRPPQRQPDSASTEDDLALQERLLQGVSRTFALTIPQLPEELAEVVGNAYLLCRIADTIEDDPHLDLAAKQHFQELFLTALRSGRGAGSFAATLHSRLSSSTSVAERELVLATPRVLRLMATFKPAQRLAISRCVTTMGRGMADFGGIRSRRGLADSAQLDRYCYTVAGVVGEMLTDLFCDHSSRIGERRDLLDPRAVRFGRGLQLTNILKDIWQDLEHGRCWLPREVFAQLGYDLDQLAPGHPGGGEEAFAAGLRHLVGVAHGDLREALRYTLAIPRSEPGVRKFLIWATLLAAMTLRNINARPLFSDGTQVKVTRRRVAATVVATRAVIRSNLGLAALFRVAARGLPGPDEVQRSPRPVVQPAPSSG